MLLNLQFSHSLFIRIIDLCVLYMYEFLVEYEVLLFLLLMYYWIFYWGEMGQMGICNYFGM